MKLYVGNLPFSASEDELRDLFGEYGDPQQVTVVVDRSNGRSRGFGFVAYDDTAAAQAAIAGLNGREFGGRNLVVNEARPESGGSRGFGGGFRGGRRDDRSFARREPGRRGRF